MTPLWLGKSPHGKTRPRWSQRARSCDFPGALKALLPGHLPSAWCHPSGRQWSAACPATR